MLSSVLSRSARRVRDFVAINGVIRSLDSATPRRFTRLLRGAGILRNGQFVTAAKIIQRWHPTRASARFELEFSGPVAPEVPRRVYLKLITPGMIRRRGRDRALREVEFYAETIRALTPCLHGMGVVQCLDAAVDGDAAHLMLTDLSDTHSQPEWPIPPLASEVEQLVDWTAAFHATWWEDPALLQLPRLTWPLDRIVGMTERYLATIADRLPAAEAARIREVFGVIEGLWTRGIIGPPPARGFVLTHGDLHLWNALYPLSPSDRLAVVDWESWNVGHPLTEAAYLIGLNWDRSRDPAGERALVERYHNRLVASGRPVCSWDECWRDYRLGILALFLVPAVFRERHIPACVWWPHIRRLHTAFDQLRCAEVLSELR